MRFPDVNINRKIGKQTYYYLPQVKKIIIDPGYEGGDIHIYQYEKSDSASNLKHTLESLLGNQELELSSNLQVKEIGHEIKSEILIFPNLE